MYTLYWDRRTRAASVHMALAETDIPFQLHHINLNKGEHKTAEYRAINPKGFVPTLVTSNGDIMTETPAMLMHVCDHDSTGTLAPVTDDPLRITFLDWFFYHVGVLHDPYKRLYFPERYSTERAHIEGIKDAAAKSLEDHWQLIEAHLSINGPYHLGDSFSVLDILLVTFSDFKSWKPDFFETFPATKRCFELVKSRPNLTAVINEHEVPSS